MTFFEAEELFKKSYEDKAVEIFGQWYSELDVLREMDECEYYDLFWKFVEKNKIKIKSDKPKKQKNQKIKPYALNDIIIAIKETGI